MKKIIRRRTDSDRRLRQNARFARLLRLMGLLQGRRRVGVKDIAEELEVHERTVYRDLEVLELAGVPWVFDRAANSYRIERWYQAPAIPITHDDLLDQAAAATIASSPGVGAGAGAKRVTGHFAAHSPEQAARVLDEAQQIMAVLDLKLATHGRNGEHLRTIQWALLERKQLAARYESPYRATPSQVTLHPYRLLLTRQAWYLIARPSGGDAPRVYRIARFRAVRLLDRAAVVPDDFDLKAFLGNAWSVFRGEERYDVELDFHPDAARIVAETNWHHTQQVRRHANGSATLTFSVDGLDEILWWLLAWSGFVTVVRPPKLRELFVEQLGAGLQQNERTKRK
jgi:predicted DNA-binding transcriptional regulator YafY